MLRILVEEVLGDVLIARLAVDFTDRGFCPKRYW